MEDSERVLIDFNRDDDLGDWRIINDGVMGGLSRSEVVFTGTGTALFRGTVSLENNGGFASTRTGPRPYELDGYGGLRIRVKGDGKAYQVRLRTGDGISYRYRFTTRAGTWMTVRAPFSEFEPVFRGRVLEDVPPVAPGKIKQIGFLIGDKQAGDFRLEIDSITASREP